MNGYQNTNRQFNTEVSVVFLLQKIQRRPLVSVQRYPILLAAPVSPTTTLACLTISVPLFPSVSFAVLTAVDLHVYRLWVIATFVIAVVVLMAASSY